MGLLQKTARQKSHLSGFASPEKGRKGLLQRKARGRRIPRGGGFRGRRFRGRRFRGEGDLGGQESAASLMTLLTRCAGMGSWRTYVRENVPVPCEIERRSTA